MGNEFKETWSYQIRDGDDSFVIFRKSTIHDSTDCHGNAIKAESGTNELGIVIYTRTHHNIHLECRSQRVLEMAYRLCCSNDNCDVEADVEATPANEVY